MTAPLSAFDLEEIASLLEDRNRVYEGRLYFLHPETAEIFLWSEDHLLNGEGPVEADDLDPDLVAIDTIDSHEAYEDMVDFTDRLNDRRVAEHLEVALDGSGAFRRFRDLVGRRHPELDEPWRAFSRARACRRAAQWLADEGIVDQEQVAAYVAEHPDPAVP